MRYQLPSDLSCSEHFSRSLDRKDFGIYDHLWVLVFIVLWFLFFFFSSVCVHEDGIAGPDNGNNPTGNWAALSKIRFSHLI